MAICFAKLYRVSKKKKKKQSLDEGYILRTRKNLEQIMSISK